MGLIAAVAKFTPGDTRRLLDLFVQVKVFSAVQRSQNIVMEEMVRNVAVDTGELRDSIALGSIVDDGKKITGTVVATAGHGGYVEFGTGRRGSMSAGAGPFGYNLNWPGMAAQPYARPSLDSARQAVLGEFQA